jgi:hypothetical protein
VYARGVPDWTSPAGAEMAQLNRNLADAYLAWMAPFVESGHIRPMPMLVVTAVVTGPTHAIVRRWLAGQAIGPLGSYQADLTDAATAALSGTPAPSRRPRPAEPRRGDLRLRLTAEDGAVIAEGAATVELLPVTPAAD